MNEYRKLEGGFCIESSNGCITYPESRTLFLIEFGNVAFQCSRPELYEFIQFLDSIQLPCCPDFQSGEERTIVIESSAMGTTLLFSPKEFAELYELLIDLQVEIALNSDSSTGARFDRN